MENTDFFYCFYPHTTNLNFLSARLINLKLSNKINRKLIFAINGNQEYLSQFFFIEKVKLPINHLSEFHIYNIELILSFPSFNSLILPNPLTYANHGAYFLPFQPKTPTLHWRTLFSQESCLNLCQITPEQGKIY